MLFVWLQLALASQVAELQEFPTQRVHLVYASQYVSNPGSVMGHTFFRFEREGSEARPLDLTLGYVAHVPEDTGGIAYFVKGALGGFMGHWVESPFSLKLLEYHAMESRDLWEFELDLTPPQVRELLIRIREAKPTPYLFFNRNCASAPLRMLESIVPGLDLSLPALYDSPMESLKVLQERGLVRQVRFRPSLRRTLLHRYELLNEEESKELFQPGSSHPRALEVGIGVLDLHQLRDPTTPTPPLKHRLLRQRARLGGRTEWEPTPRPPSPLESHPPHLLGISAGIRDGQPLGQLDFHWGAHDLMSKGAGFVPFSEVKVLAPTLEFFEDNLRLQRFEALSLLSLTPMGWLETPWSWSIQLAYSQEEGAHVGQVEPALGLSLGGNQSILSMLALLNLEGGELNRGGPGIQLLGLLSPVPWLKFHLSGTWITDLFQGQRPLSRIRTQAKIAVTPWNAWEILLSGSVHPQREALLGLRFLF